MHSFQKLSILAALVLGTAACSDTEPDTDVDAAVALGPKFTGDAATAPAMGLPQSPVVTPSAGAPGTATPLPADAGTSPNTLPSTQASDAGSPAAPTTSPQTGDAGTAAPTAAPSACDRACLVGVLQQYLDALVAKDPSKLKVAASLKVTENGVVSKLGEGLWKTASSLVDGLRLDYADPVEGQVGTQLMLNENGSTKIIYMVRLKVVSREIAEVETMVVRQRGAANGFFNTAKMQPEPVFLQAIPKEKRMSREDLKKITELYLDYLEGKKKGPDVPFDAGCKRYENGQVTATGLSSFNAQSWGFKVTRRILVIDEEAGITWGMFPFSQADTALVVGEAFKLIEGKIMMVQAVMANQPAKVWD
ncbi:MAG: hypothetical protein RL385_2828 [Pseudomonadota bacterium]|jgi:hypothetical protein